MLLRQDTESEKRTRQDYDKTGLRTPPVERLRYNFKSFRYAVRLSGTVYDIEKVCSKTT